MNETLVQTWEIGARINLYVLDALTPEQWATSIAKGKSVPGQFTHIHSVRLMWLKSAAPDLWEGLEKLDGKECSREQARDSLERSAERVAALIARAGTPEGRIKGFKPHCAAFVAHLAAHESFHRAQLELGLRQAGVPLPDAIAYGTWEWGSR